MIKLPGLIFLFFAISVKSQHKTDLIISNPIIVQVSDGSLIRGKDILLQGDRIISVIKHKNHHSGIKVIDASNKYLIPGLWDMHIHFGGGDTLVEENKNLLPLFIAFGITAVRDASADLSPYVLKWRSEIANGKLSGPTIFTSGPKIEGINSIWVGDIEVGSLADLQKAMDSLQRLKVDFFKITDNTIKPDIYLAAIS
jgi:hypothetical protein